MCPNHAAPHHISHMKHVLIGFDCVVSYIAFLLLVWTDKWLHLIPLKRVVLCLVRSCCKQSSRLSLKTATSTTMYSFNCSISYNGFTGMRLNKVFALQWVWLYKQTYNSPFPFSFFLGITVCFLFFPSVPDVLKQDCSQTFRLQDQEIRSQSSYFKKQTSVTMEFKACLFNIGHQHRHTWVGAREWGIPERWQRL